MNKRIATRFVICLFGIAALFGLWRLVQWYTSDPVRFTTADTVGWVSALEYTDRGARAVVFMPNGESKVAPGGTETSQDMVPVWNHSGNHLFFASDREEGSFHIHRWTLGNNRLDRRTFGSRSVTNPWFAHQPLVGGRDHPLVSAGGLVFQLDVSAGKMDQVVPPVLQLISGEEGAGLLGQLDQYKGMIGLPTDATISVRSGKYTPDRSTIYAIIRRDGGEVFFAQMVLGTPELQRPIPLFAGSSVEYDVGSDGTAVVVLRNFQFPNPDRPPQEFIQNGRVVKPFRHAVFMVQLTAEGPQVAPLLISTEDDLVISEAVISPDASRVVVIVGRQTEDGSFAAEQMRVMPLAPNGFEQSAVVTRGDVRNPAWSPDGERIAFVRGVPGQAQVAVVRRDGSGLVALSDEGDWSYPAFSPQLPQN